MKKRLLTAVGIAFSLVVSTIFQSSIPNIAHASSQINVLEDDGGNTIEAQDYEAWTKPITSYAVDTDEGLMSVRYIENTNTSGDGKIVVCYYDTDFHIIDRKVIPSELPIWGGFGASSDTYYLVTGQNNLEESDEKEVIRITKYDKKWNKIGSAGAKACNVYDPFAFATVRMDFYNQYLIIKTGRTIYQTDDGAHHQVQLTLEVDTENMSLIDSGTDYGYVSHSLNQFIKVDGNKIVSVEQGDSYPRGIILFESDNLLAGASDDSFSHSGNIDTTTVFEVPNNDDYYQNLRASIGALEISDSGYLIAGNSVVQDEMRAERTTRNVFVIFKNKNTNEVQTNWLTSYSEGDGTVNTPHMIKVSDNSYMVLWSRNNTVYYTLVDGEGKQIGQIYHHIGNLSDCQPVLLGGDKICWYTVDGIDMNFYTISASNPSDFVVKESISGHQYYVKNVESGISHLSCSVCGNEENLKVLPSISTLWNMTGAYERYRYGLPDESLELNQDDKIYFWVTFDDDLYVNDQINIEISDTDILSYTAIQPHLGYFTVLADGVVKVTVSVRWNPNLNKEFSLKIGNVPEETPTAVPTGMPTASPTIEPTVQPTASPTIEPTVQPTASPTIKPTALPNNSKLSKVSSLKLTAGKKKFTAKWNEVKTAKGYQYQYGLSKSKMEKAKKKTVKKPMFTIKGLKKNKTYYVRVRAYKKSGKNTIYGKWSTVKKVKIKK